MRGVQGGARGEKGGGTEEQGDGEGGWRRRGGWRINGGGGEWVVEVRWLQFNGVFP